MMLVLGIRKYRSGAAAMHAKDNTFTVHGLKGKTGNKNENKMAQVHLDLKDFFEKLLDGAEIPSICILRELTEIGLHAGE